MIAMFVSNDNCPGAADRTLHLFCRFRIERLRYPTPKKIVDLLIHTGVEHDVAIGIHNLEHGARLNARLIRRSFHGEFFGATAFCKLQDVNAKWGWARNHPRGLPYLTDVCRPGLLSLRRRQEKRERKKMTCVFHRLSIGEFGKKPVEPCARMPHSRTTANTLPRLQFSSLAAGLPLHT